MQSRPNIVLITVDQMRGDCLGVAGHPVVETPNLDMMKRHGSYFPRAYSATPTCIPARAALLTGLSQRSHGRIGYRDGVPWTYPRTIATEFAAAGYHTQTVGKMHVYPARNLCGFHNVVLHDGYLHFERDETRAHNDSFMQADDYLLWLRDRLGVNTDLTDSGLECNSWVARPFPYEERYHPTNWVVSESIDFLRRRDPTKPFFLFSSFVRPHSPLDPPAYYFDLYARRNDLPPPMMGDWADLDDAAEDGLDINAKWGRIPPAALHRARAAYYGHLTHIDHQLGRLFETMGEYRLLNNTIFLFTSDHGDMLGDHNLFRKALPYEGSARVPFLIYDPGNVLGVRQNQTPDTLVELRDVMPTLLDMAGIAIPDTVEGHSLLPVLSGQAGQVHPYIHGEHNLEHLSNHFIVTERDKYVWFSQTGREQYFDLLSDPTEEHNAIDAPENRERIASLRAHLVTELTGREEGYVAGGQLVTGRETKAVLEHPGR